VVDAGASPGGIELHRPPVQPHLELCGGPPASRRASFKDDGKVTALALREGEVVPLAAAPLAVAPRSDGIWRDPDRGRQ